MEYGVDGGTPLAGGLLDGDPECVDTLTGQVGARGGGRHSRIVCFDGTVDLVLVVLVVEDKDVMEEGKERKEDGREGRR